jgi:hypothetical protein
LVHLAAVGVDRNTTSDAESDTNTEDAGDGEEREWHDPTVAAWEAMSAASGSPGLAADPRDPPSPELAAALDALDWEQVHRALIPNVWNRIKLATFTETWAVLGVLPPLDAATDPRRRVTLEAYGTGGLTHAVKHLRPVRTPTPFKSYPLPPTTPYTLHPTPCTLHPTPYTLHPAP